MDSLAKHLGMFVEHKQISGPDDGPIGVTMEMLLREVEEDGG